MDFPQAVEYCKALIAKPNHSKAYKKKMVKEYMAFINATGKGLYFDESDIKSYLINLKQERQFSYSSLKLNWASIVKGFKEESGGVCLRTKYPDLNSWVKNLYTTAVE